MTNRFFKIQEKMGKDVKMDDLLQYRTGTYYKNRTDILTIKITGPRNKNPLCVFNSSPNAAEIRISEVGDMSAGNCKMKDRKKKKRAVLLILLKISFTEQKVLIKIKCCSFFSILLRLIFV